MSMICATRREENMRRISSTGITGLPVQVLTGILLAAALATAVPAALSLRGTDLVIALLIVTAILLSIAALRIARVTIDVSATEVVIAFRPFFSRRLILSELTSVAVSHTTSAAEGFGYRILGKNQRGLLVGGPTITIGTPERTWVVSVDNPAEVIEILNAQVPTRSQP